MGEKEDFRKEIYKEMEKMLVDRGFSYREAHRTVRSIASSREGDEEDE